MLFAGRGFVGGLASSLAALSLPPYYGKSILATYNKKGYLSPRSDIYGVNLNFGANIYIDDHVVVYQGYGGGGITLKDGVHINRDTIIQTGNGGSVVISKQTHIQSRCQFSAYVSTIHIGERVQIAPNCSFYPYNHGIAPNIPMGKQPLQTKGGIFVDDGAWLGVGVIVLDGVRIGKGAVIGAGSVVTHDIPDNAIATGVPAVVKMFR